MDKYQRLQNMSGTTVNHFRLQQGLVHFIIQCMLINYNNEKKTIK